MSEREFAWIGLTETLLLHGRQIAEHGGADGTRDMGMLESALARPINQFLYDPSKDIFDFAASYAYGIIANHPFVDGNKRTGLVVCETFLLVNGFVVADEHEQKYRMYLGIADGSTDESAAAAWLRANSEPT